MNQEEFQEWVIKDTVKSLIQALLIYAVALTAYWQFVG